MRPVNAQRAPVVAGVRTYVRRWPAAPLLMLLALDAFFVLLHIPQVVDLGDLIYRLPGVAERIIFRRQWSLGQDGGYAELYGYGKAVVAVVLLLVLYRRRRQPVYLAWAAMFLVIILDDALQLHERGGSRLAQSAGLPDLVVEATNLGELIVWALFAVPLVPLVMVCYQRSDAHAQALSQVLAVFVAILVLFAVFVDVVHVTLTGHAAWIVGTVEDGGELVVMSFVVLSVLAAPLPEPAPSRPAIRMPSRCRRG